MLSRLKGIETKNHKLLLNQIFFSSDMLSRLKGIETANADGETSEEETFRYAFPFEGN